MRPMLALLLTIVWTGLAGETPPTFTQKPSAVNSADKTKVTFAVSRETDVAVFIEDANGNVVRHLVAGMLGKNPPSPFEAGTLVQSVEWDGKADYGKPAGQGPFKVRVSLGLGAKYDKIVHSDPQSFGGILSMAVAPDGTLYLRTSTGGSWPNGTGEIMVSLDRNGTYQRMIMPYPSNLPKEKVPGVGIQEIDGRPAPIVRRVEVRDYYGSTGWFRSGMAVTPGGQILYPVVGLQLAAIAADGSIPWGSLAGPFLLGKWARAYSYQRVFVTVSSDGTQAYLAGLGDTESGATFSRPHFAVYRAKLPERGPAEIFFGDPSLKGMDGTHLGGLPTGLALDGKGNVLIGDPGNKRIAVVNEQNGKFVGSFTANAPDCVAVDPHTGAVYVTCRTGQEGGIELIKYNGWKDAAIVAKVGFPRDGNPEAPPMMVLDAEAKPPIVWLGTGRLLRIEDQGSKFGEPKRINTNSLGRGDFIDLSVDRIRKEVYYRADGYWRFSESQDKSEPFKVSPQKMTLIQQLLPGYDGNIYLHGYPGTMERFDHAAKPLPWPGLGASALTAVTDMYVNIGHQMGGHPDGRIFSFENPAKGVQRHCRVLREFDLHGNAVAWGPVWHVSEVAVGPKFDPQGNIYIAEQIRPKDASLPPSLESSSYLYGSIVKFSPKGGLLGYANPPMPADGSKPQLDSSLKSQDALWIPSENRLSPVKITGAEWMRMGVSHIEHAGCTCESARFDVDEFGRVFYPDLCRFRVGVLDTNGNEICHFGGYGNAECKGPDSPVIDARTGVPRPRRSDDPKELKSPFAEPDIAFAWLIGVGVTDRYAYMGDTLNRRLLRAKLVYAVEETCEIK